MSDSSTTKKALAKSMKELLSVRPFSEIHVHDICSGCGMNRKSLYYHFEDKYDLVNWIFYSELIKPLEQYNYSDFWDLMLHIVTYLHQNQTFYYHAFQIQGENCFSDYFSARLQPYMMKHLDLKQSASTYYSSIEKRTAYAKWTADAYVLSIKKWIVNGPALPPERYVDLYRV